MAKDAYQILQETKAEGAQARPRPVPARFVLADGTELVPPDAETKPAEPPP